MKQVLILFLVVTCVGLFSRCNVSDSSLGSADKYRVTIDVVPENGGTVTPGNGSYKEGDELEVLAIPADSTWQFHHWSGDHVGIDTAITLIVSKDMNIKAVFSKK